MALLKDDKYYKITNLTIDLKAGTTEVLYRGYEDKDAAKAHKVQKANHRVTVQGVIGEVADAYEATKKDPYFTNAKDI
jgi:hypothetical protein